MDVLEAGRRVLGALGVAGELARPVREVVGARGHWERTAEGAFDRRAATRLGPLRLGGAVVAEVHLMRTGEPPLDGFDAAESADTAFASLVLSGTADEALAGRVPLGRPGASLDVGFDAGASVTIAHHRRCRIDESARVALADLLRHLADPWDLGRVANLSEGEALVLESTGSVALRADAGWALARVRRLELLGVASAPFRLEAPLAVEAGVTVGARVAATLSGRVRLVVTRGGRAGRVRVRLLRRREDLVGLGLTLAARVDLENAEAFAEAVVGRVFTVPDGLAAEVAALLARLDAVACEVDALGARAQAAVARALGGEGTAVTLDEIAAGIDGLRSLAARSPAVRRLLDRVDRVVAALGDARGRLERFVDDGFAALTLPLSEARRRLADWLARVDALRGEVHAHLERVVTREIAAGVNRGASHEALLDVEVRLADRADAYLALLAGNWLPALEAVRAGGANGVEISRCALVDVVRKDRHLELRLDLVGRELCRSLAAWTELRVERDRPDAALAVVSGNAGATLAQRLGGFEEASVVFDLAAVAAAGEGLTRLDVAARITRSLTETRLRVIPKLIRAHLAAARNLGRLDEARAAAVGAALLAERGAYTYAFDLALPPAAAPHVLLLDVEAGERELRRRAWAAFLAAAKLAEQALPGGGRRVRLLSECVTPAMTELVVTRPGEVLDVVVGRRAQFTRLPRVTEAAAWLHLLQAHAFIGALLAARAAVRARRDVQSIADELARLAARTRDQVGVVAGTTVEAKYVMLACLAGPERRALALTFTRGTVSVTV
jgi:hypothetical protein